MKKKNRTSSYASNNPRLEDMHTVELPIIAPEAYDVPSPFSRTESHFRKGNTPHNPCVNNEKLDLLKKTTPPQN